MMKRIFSVGISEELYREIVDLKIDLYRAKIIDSLSFRSLMEIAVKLLREKYPKA